MAEIQNIDREMVRLEQQFRESREQKKGGKGKVTFSRESKKRRNVPSVRSSPRRKLAR